MKIVLIIFVLFLLSSCHQRVNTSFMNAYSAPISFAYSDIFEDSGKWYEKEARYFEWIETTESTCFDLIGWDEEFELLCVRFRESGAVYVYFDVPRSVWDALYSADSRGGFYNKAIKGIYDCERIIK